MSNLDQVPCRVIAIGCSWGGLSALTRFLDNVPADLDTAIAIAQHRAHAPSNLAELLGQHTSWPVCEVEDKEPIAPCHVYLAPPGYHLLVDERAFALSTDEPVRHSRPSIDVFFESAADALSDRVVAVVLTGANDDGAAGAAKVARRGGLVFVQDPETAEKRTMPEAALAVVPSAIVGRLDDLPAMVVTALTDGTEAQRMTDDRVPVLVVDDRPDNLLAVEAVLEPLQLEVIRAQSGREALRHLLTEDVAVILLDVQMPELDGFETARLIKSRARTENIPIIFLTALSREIEHQLEGYGTGAVDYLAKPFEPEVLRSKVSAFVNLFRQARIIERQREELAQRLVERDRAEAALRVQTVELERSNAELERFAFVASHELREPLQVVTGFLDLLQHQLGDVPGETSLLIERAGAGIERMISLIDELLAYARATTGEQHLTTFSLAEVFLEVRERMAADIERSSATITVDPLPQVHGDRWQLSRVLANLLDNAVRFRGDRDPVVHVGVSSRDGWWVISVRDNGCGIPEVSLPTLFTIAGSVHSGLHGPGLGVGLPLCRRVVERHGGDIWIESVVDRGTTVSFTLPSATPAA